MNAVEGPAAAPVTTRSDRLDRSREPGRRIGSRVGRLPTGVQAKLLGGLLSGVVLVVAIGLLGLRAITDANDRAGALRIVQQRATVYRALQADVDQVHQLLGLRAGGPDLGIFVGQTAETTPSGAALKLLDETIATTLTRLGPGGDVADLAVVAPPRERESLDRILLDEGKLAAVMDQIIALDGAGRKDDAARLQGSQAEPLKTDLEAQSDLLVSATTAETSDLLAANAASVDASRWTFATVAGLSIVLAVMLGLALSNAVIRPIRKMEARVAGIAKGDFAGHVDVANRDELGALAANINRMNDELGRLYRELETASRHKSEFLANMSHELRTPLNAIIGFSDVLEAEMAGPLNERQRRYVEDVRDAGAHLLSLINDILDLSKVEAGRMELAVAEMAVEDALEQGLTMQAERAARQDVALHLAVAPDVGTIQADERKIRQVIFNLVSNAVKFTPPGGRVDVSAVRRDGEVEIAVADTGPGISEADQERIFEEFAQALRPGDRPAEGTGLGLTLARRFVELHGGRLWVESEPGSGSTFRFILPTATLP